MRIDDNVSGMVSGVEKLELQEYGSSSHEKKKKLIPWIIKETPGTVTRSQSFKIL